LPDGRIELLGRLDDQIKLRGYRIELGEIEAVLRSCVEVKEAAVVLREDPAGEKSLAAFVVLHHESAESSATLRDQLRQKLPDFMIPASFTFLAQLPLTPSGKVDRKALANQAKAAPTPRRAAVPPQSELECELAVIWQTVLRVDQVGVQDNFFDLGGHSLMVMQLISRLHESLHLQVPVHLVFAYPTIEQLASALENLRGQPPESAQRPIARLKRMTERR
jgi:acyl carrier protein